MPLKPLSDAPQSVRDRCFDRARIYLDPFAVYCVLMAQAGYAVPEPKAPTDFYSTKGRITT